MALGAPAMTPRDYALAQLGRGPCTVGMLTGSLLTHGFNYPDANQKAMEALAALVIEKRAELVEVHGTDIYRISATTPVEKSTEPAPKARGVRR